MAVAGDTTSSPSLTPSQDSTRPLPRMPVLTLRSRARPSSTTNRPIVDNHGVAGRRTAFSLFAADDIRFDAHSHPQRRLLGQPDPDAKRLRYRIARRRDLLDEAGQDLVGERIGAQQRLLSDLDPGNILLVDVGRRPIAASRDRSGKESCPGSTMSPTSPSSFRTTPSIGDKLVIFKPLGLGGDLRPDPRQVALGFLIGLRSRDAARDNSCAWRSNSRCETLQCPQVVQRRLRLLVVETGKDIAALDALSFAAAPFDDPAAHQRRRARPCLGLDRYRLRRRFRRRRRASPWRR